MAKEFPDCEFVQSTNGAGVASARKGRKMNCEKCFGPNPPDARFCNSCGAILVPAITKCPKCATPGDPSAALCLNCGTSLARPDSAAAAPNLLKEEPPAPLPSLHEVRLPKPTVTATPNPPRSQSDQSSGTDRKIAAIVVWLACALGVFIALTVWTSTGASEELKACIARGGSGSGCGSGPLWVKLLFVGSILGFGLGGRLWTRR